MATAPTQTIPAPTIKVPHVGSADLVREFHLLTMLWPLAALLVAAGAVKLTLYVIGQRRLRRAGIADIDRMDGMTFELKLASLFQSQGYAVDVVGRRGDFGGDLVVARGGRRTVVQAKRRSNKKVGIDAVNQVVGARGYYGAEQAMVVTNWYFTAPARTQAEKNDVLLWDRERLVDELLKVAGGPAFPAPVAAPAQATVAEPASSAHCARCGKAVSEKVVAYCRSHPKRFAGLVYCFDDQRSLP